MKDRQDSIAARIAGTITGGMRRRQQEREPRALVYDAAGEPRVVAAGSEAHAALLEAAEALVDIALADGGTPARGDEADAADEADGAPEADAADAEASGGDES